MVSEGSKEAFQPITLLSVLSVACLDEHPRRPRRPESQAAAVAVKLKGEFAREAKERQRAAGKQHGRGKPKKDSSAPQGAKLYPKQTDRTKRADEQAAALTGASGRSVARAEFVQKKDFTTSERVAIAETIAAEQRAKHGERRGRPAME